MMLAENLELPFIMPRDIALMVTRRPTNPYSRRYYYMHVH